METYYAIRQAIADEYPHLLEEFDNSGFSSGPSWKMGDWLDEKIPIDGGWGRREIINTDRLIRESAKAQLK